VAEVTGPRRAAPRCAALRRVAPRIAQRGVPPLKSQTPAVAATRTVRTEEAF